MRGKVVASIKAGGGCGKGLSLKATREKPGCAVAFVNKVKVILVRGMGFGIQQSSEKR